MAVALLSAVGLIWEITLTRLASVILSYHYAFVAVALAILGLGLGAALVYALPEASGRRALMPAAAISALAFLVVAFVTPAIADTGSLPGLLLLALVPFLTLGIAMASAFRAQLVAASLLYAADLGGAGLGAVLAIAGLDAIGPFGVLFALTAVAAVGALVCGQPVAGLRRRRSWSKLGALVLLLMGVLGLVVQIVRAPLTIDYATLRNAPPDKTIVQILQDPSQHARIVDTRWDAFARTDVVQTNDPTQRVVFTDGGAGTYMLNWDGNISSQSALSSDLETLPFLLGPHADILIIGAGGGIDVVRALVAGARHVTAVELNGATVVAVRAEGAYNGHVLDRPNVTTVVDDGRHFLASTHHRYDTILMNLVYSGISQATGDALAENYIFTTQGMKLYLEHLTPRGRVGIISHQALEGLRAFTTGVEALHQEGNTYSDALLRSTVLMTNNQSPEVRPTLTVLQNSVFNKPELDLLQARGTTDLNLRPLYVPYLFRGSFDLLASGQQTLSQFLQGSDYAIGPTDDNQPFFFNLNAGLPDGLGGALWVVALVLAGVLSLVFFLRDPAPMTSAPKRPGAVWLLGLYMSLLGIGFMCVEVPLIQRFILVLGEPVLALTIVLATLLIGGGVGSLIGGWLLSSRRQLLPLVPLVVAAVLLLEQLVLPSVATHLLGAGQGATIILSILLVAPLGLIMGIPFPQGLQIAADLLPGDIALFWAINALFSVAGAVLAAVVAIQVGFGFVLLCGMGCYVLASGALVPLRWGTTVRRSETPTPRQSVAQTSLLS